MNKKLITTLLLSPLAASAFAVNAGAASDKQVFRSENGIAHTVAGQLGKINGSTAEDRAFAGLNQVARDFGFAQAEGNFQLKSSQKDEVGITHTRMTQVINGIQVFGAEAVVSEKNGHLLTVTSGYQALAPNTSEATVSEADAVKAAIASTGFTGELSTPPRAKLGYLPQDGQAVLTYEVEVSYLGDTPGRHLIYVNAANGSIVQSLNLLEHAVGTGTDSFGRTVTLNTTYRNGSYYLETYTVPENVLIRTRDMRNTTSYIYSCTDPDNVWNSSYQTACVEAHYHAEKVYYWYYNNVGRNSIDGNGMNIESLVHYSRNYNNAFWNGTYMVYGDGDGTNLRSFTAAIDVTMHEMTHGVTEHTSGLLYQDQSGALNESWSDAFGATIDSNDWLMGEDLFINGGAIRDMANPNAYGDPDHMSDYVNTTSDNGGVHTNSGIPNKAFYNFATAIGSRTIAAKVWYQAQYHMTANTNFSGARAATVQSAQELYGSTYTTALQNAWSAVGVY